MRRILSGFLLAVCIASTSLVAVPGYAQQGEAQTFAQQYEAWQKTQDSEQRIAQGEKLLVLAQNLDTLSFEGGARTRSPISASSSALAIWHAPWAIMPTTSSAPSLILMRCSRHGRAVRTAGLGADPQHLGIAYWQRIRGERADNQDPAIAHFEAAQTVFTREAVPEQWAHCRTTSPSSTGAA